MSSACAFCNAPLPPVALRCRAREAENRSPCPSCRKPVSLFKDHCPDCGHVPEARETAPVVEEDRSSASPHRPFLRLGATLLRFLGLLGLLLSGILSAALAGLSGETILAILAGGLVQAVVFFVLAAALAELHEIGQGMRQLLDRSRSPGNRR